MYKLNEEETKKYNKWAISHTCQFTEPMSIGAIGGRLTYSFTPTGLGTIIKITCACGEETDVTSYEHW